LVRKENVEGENPSLQRESRREKQGDKSVTKKKGRKKGVKHRKSACKSRVTINKTKGKVTVRATNCPLPMRK